MKKETGFRITHSILHTASFLILLSVRIRFRHTGLVLSWVIRGVASTLRFEVIDRTNLLRTKPRNPLIWIFWHNRMFLIPYLHECWLPGCLDYILSSPSGDGQIIADICAQFGLGAARGSSSKPEKGMSALIKLAEKIKSGSDVGITPDGPRGPCYQLSPGTLKLAQITGAGILPVHVQYEKCWELKTWDRFQIPRPFSKVRIVIGEPTIIPRRLGEAGFEEQRLALEKRLQAGASSMDEANLAAL